METTILFYILVLLCMYSAVVDASLGDRSRFYVECEHECRQTNCSNATQFAIEQPFVLKLMRWTCHEECAYNCMWSTIAYYRLADQRLVQFHGKWPFYRLWGMQEPASVLFSLANLASFYYMSEKLLSMSGKLHSSHAQFFRRVWLLYSVLGSATWAASALFHARDTPFTEKLDYFGAFACVLFKLGAAVLRLAYPKHEQVVQPVLGAVLCFYSYHVYQLIKVFDYGYNMAINVGAGSLSTLLWVAFALHQIRRGRANQVWQCITVVVCASGLLLLELCDFAPLYYTLDAHSLWHAGTALLPLLWTRFLLYDMAHIEHNELYTNNNKPNVRDANHLLHSNHKMKAS